MRNGNGVGPSRGWMMQFRIAPVRIASELSVLKDVFFAASVLF